MVIKVKRLRHGAKLPSRAYDAPLGYDLYFCPADGKPLVIYNGYEPVAVQTGVAIEPPPGFGFIIKERGSMGTKGLAIRAGVVDEDWRGEVIVWMQLITSDYKFPRYVIQPGDKIAQFILIPTPKDEVIEVETLSDTERGMRYLGSSGK